MKKILSVVVFILAGTFLFAQSAAYKNHLKNAKDFEAKKKWVYALASYYDAMEAEPTAAGLEAYEGYISLANTLISGKPGYGEFDEFDTHDGWKNIVNEYYEYWDKTCPWDFLFSKLEKGENNYENRTTKYTISWRPQRTFKCSEITSVIQDGFRIAEKSDWNFDFNEKSVLKPYIIDFSITDKNNKDLIPDFNEHYYYIRNYKEDEFSASAYVSQDIVAQLKDDNIKIKVPNHCEKEKNVCIDKFADFHDVIYDTKNARYYSPYKSPKEPVNALKLLAIEKLKKNPGKLVTIPKKKFKIMNCEVTQKLYKSVMKENPSYFKGDYLPVENISFYDAIYFCNLLSVKQGYTPVYSVNGETDVTKWGYTPHKGNGFNQEISQNLAADGYRLPTYEEWDYAAKAGTEYLNQSKAYAWLSDNSDYRTHWIMQKLPNKYGLYDMVGNVSEMVWNSINVGGNYEYREISAISEYKSSKLRYVGFRLARSIIK